MKPKRIVHQKVLSGEPLDGSGKLCIHFFVRDEHGLFVEPHVLSPENGKLRAGPVRGRLACDPKRGVAPVTRGNEVTITHRTDSAEAVTCPKCKATIEYQEAIKRG